MTVVRCRGLSNLVIRRYVVQLLNRPLRTDAFARQFSLTVVARIVLTTCISLALRRLSENVILATTAKECVLQSLRR